MLMISSYFFRELQEHQQHLWVILNHLHDKSGGHIWQMCLWSIKVEFLGHLSIRQVYTSLHWRSMPLPISYALQWSSSYRSLWVWSTIIGSSQPRPHHGTFICKPGWETQDPPVGGAGGGSLHKSQKVFHGNHALGVFPPLMPLFFSLQMPAISLWTPSLTRL